MDISIKDLGLLVKSETIGSTPAKGRAHKVIYNSAFYELIEWWVAVLTKKSAEAFLGTQGYVWHTQSDMSLALTGAILALAFLSKAHNKYIPGINETDIKKK